ncbi:hypothetical protein ACFFMN_37865 [Planobispora siamensis]|uniref:Uncharacterized protein n=1 Tax=Planobispora siamensis TaxID=936338 RepID=A0A8J3SKI2_9ACTN|nr:hypothetical protein [Planobispora siamensis]GIH96083.1 hypothetical protein Psi01_67130 [Planobispora siamensis]
MVSGRYDIIEAEEPKGPRRWIGAVVLAALVAIPVVSMLTSRQPAVTTPFPTSVPVPSASLGEQVPNVLHPPVRRRDGWETVRAVFPDGGKAELRYPAELRIAQLGVRPAQGGWLEGYFGLFRWLTTPGGGAAELSGRRPMIREMGDNVTLWPARNPDDGQVMVFDFAPWSLALQDGREGMTFEQRMLWAENLKGKVTKDGYLVLAPRLPVRLAAPGQIFGKELVGPQLWFGGARETLIVLAPIPGCDITSIELPMIEQRRRFSAEMCQNGFYVAASGSRGSVEQIMAGLRVAPAK